METYTYDQCCESARALQARLNGFCPKVLLILGSGLGALADAVEDPIAVPYDQVPHMKRSTAPDHAGQFVFGRLAGTDVAVMQDVYKRQEMARGNPAVEMVKSRL